MGVTQEHTLPAKICLKKAWIKPAGPLAAFHLRFPTQQLMIGLLSCKRQGQLLAQPTVPGSVGPNPWDCHQNGHFGWLWGTQGWDRAPVSALCWDVASLLGSGAPTGVEMLLAQGTGCHCCFGGPVVYYAAISMSQYWWGIPVFQRVAQPQ